MTKFVTLSIDRLNQLILALNSYCNTGEIDCADDLVAELLAERDQKQGEQELCCESWSVNRIDDLGKIVDSSGRLIATVYGLQAEKIVACHNSYTKPKPQGEQEPSLVVAYDKQGWRQMLDDMRETPDGTPLYTHPQREQEPAETFDEVWAAIDWDKWRMEPIRELVREIHSKTSPQPKRDPLTDE